MTLAETSSPGAELPGRERSLLWFYLLLALAAGAFAFFALAWRPLRAGHWERQVRAAYERGDVKAAGKALDKLDALGPAARAAVGRLLLPNGAWYRGQVVQELGRKENRWMLPALVRLAREDGDAAVVRLAISAAESMSGRIFFPPVGGLDRAGLDEARSKLREWWDREGRAKFGG
jgi:hypothetical protein